MGRHRQFITSLALGALVVNAVSTLASSPLKPYLPRSTFIIRDMRFAPAISPQRSSIFQNTPQQQTGLSPQSSFSPSRLNPSRTQSQGVTQRPQQAHVPASRPTGPGTPFQQQDVSAQKPHVPPQMHLSVTPNQQPSRESQGSGNYQPVINGGRDDHRFTTPFRPIVHRQSPTLYQTSPRTPLNQNTLRQAPELLGNTIAKPARRHHTCGVLPPSGDCRAAFPRYYYNNDTDQCECFLYGGCGHEGLKYSYRNLAECHQTCLPGNKEEGISCKQIFHADEDHYEPSPGAVPWPLATGSNPNIPQSRPIPNHILPPVDTSHMSDQQIIMYLLKASRGSRGNAGTENNESRH
ncbi:Serine peptidase inhibitor, Kunitz type 2 [Halocaridina rubra]|uniref:Serine peptidase inhibitor, Kunitz type 2 n=1 Tax=Halocaridina rubra TaxID=373956 RepID=A0AAN8XGN3_HALRR